MFRNMLDWFSSDRPTQNRQTRKRQFRRARFHKNFSRACGLEPLEHRHLLAVFSFSNPSAISFSDTIDPGTPYPSTIDVSALPDTVTEVTVDIHDFSAGEILDASILLAGPVPTVNVILMRYVGNGIAANMNYTFQDGSPQMSFIGVDPDGTYSPTDFDSGNNLPAPALAEPYGSALSVFNGISANGTWNLFVANSYGNDSGSIGGGWTLNIDVTPTTFAYDASDNAAITDYTLQLNAAGTILQIVETANPANVLAEQYLAATTSVNIIGQDSIDDTLTIDYVNGAPLPTDGISFDGGTGFDSLEVVNYTGVDTLTVNHNTAPLGGPFSGIVQVGVGAPEISFSNIEPLTNVGTAADIVYNLPATADEAVLEDVAAAGMMRLRSVTLTFETTTFSIPTNSLTINLGGGDDILEVRSFDVAWTAPTINLNGQGGEDEIRIGTTPAGTTTNVDLGLGAPVDRAILGAVIGDPDNAATSFAQFNTGVSTVDFILGAVVVADSGTVGQLYVDDSGNTTDKAVTFSNSSIAGVAPGVIDYVPGQILDVELALGSGDDVINVVSTGAPDNPFFGSGTIIYGNDGDDTFTINGDNLSGFNSFLGGGGNDQFILNVANHIGANGLYPILSLDVHGDAPAADSEKRDRLIINDSNVGFVRNLNYQYDAANPGGVDIQPNVPGAGLFGPANLSLEVRTLETVIFNSADANDIVQVTGTDDDDLMTVALLPNNNSALFFLGGDPYLNTPPATIADSRPGVSGGGSGPDLLIHGLAPAAGITLDGGGTTGDGDRAIVYAASENDLVDVGNPTDIFGFGAGVLQPGFGANGAYDTMFVDGSGATTFNNVFGPLTQVNLNTASFVQNLPADSSQRAALIVNGGDESGVQASGIADEFHVTPSALFNIQVNGNLPDPATFDNGVPQGDQLNVTFTGSINVFSDDQSPPTVTLTGQTSNGDPPFGVRYSSIERANITSGNGIINIIGDNDTAGAGQDDYFKVRGGHNPFLPPPQNNGVGQFSLQIGGSWDPSTGNIGTPAPSGGLSDPIWFHNVTRINAMGGASDGFDVNGNAIPNTTDSAGVNALDLTPYADNTPVGWGIETYWTEGNGIPSGGLENPDLLIYNGVAGVSENIVIQPSDLLGGQVFSNNAATGTPIAVVNYMLNSHIIVNGNDGALGDTDTLTLRGTDPANPNTSGNETVLADFSAAGTGVEPMVRMYDAGPAPTDRPTAAELADTAGVAPNIMVVLQDFTNLDTIHFELLGGSDVFALLAGRNDGSLGINVNGGTAGSDNSLMAYGTSDGSDSFEVISGASSDAGVLRVQRDGAGAATEVNFSGMDGIQVDGGGGTGNDALTVHGTGANNVFTVVGLPTGGTAQVDAGSVIGFGEFGSDDATVTFHGGGGNDTLALSTTNNVEEVLYTPNTANGGQLRFGPGASNDFELVDIGSVSIDGLDGDDTLTVTVVDAIITSTGPQSGTIAAFDILGNPLLPLTYTNFPNVGAAAGAGTLVVQGSEGNDTISVLANGDVEVIDGFGNTNTFSAANFDTLVINALGGDDSITIQASTLFSGGITVIGGEGNDSLTIESATATIDLAGSRIADVVDGDIAFSGIETLNVNGIGGTDAFTINGYGSPTDLTALNVDGAESIDLSLTNGPDTLDFTALSMTAAALSIAAGPALSITGFTNTAGALTVDGLGNMDAIRVHGSSGADWFQVSQSGAGTVVTQTIGGNLWVQLDFANVQGLQVLGGAGDDTLTVDNSNGLVALPNGIVFHGGDGHDTLLLTGSTAVDSSVYSVGPNVDQGTVVHTLGAASQTIHFAGLEPLIDIVPAGTLTVNATNGDNAISYIEGPNSGTPLVGGVASGLVSIDGFETVEFANKAELIINALAGNDVIHLNSPATPTGLTSITVNGGDPTASGKLVVNGSAGADDIDYSPAGADEGSVTVNGFPINFTGIESVAINGQGGEDNLTVTTFGGFDQVTLIPGMFVDSGRVEITAVDIPVSNPPLEFSNLGDNGSITFEDALGSNDTLIYLGTAGDDAFDVDATGVVLLNNQLPVNTPGISVLVLRGLDGDDTFNVVGNHPYTNVLVEGGNPSASDVLNFLGSGAGEVTVNLEAKTVHEDGFGPVTFSGIEHVHTNTGTADLTVLGTPEDDLLTYTPTGVASGTYVLDGINTVFSFSNLNTSVFLVDLGDNQGDHVVVQGTNSHDVITVDGPNRRVDVENVTGVVFAPIVLHASVETVTIKARLGNDTIIVVPAPQTIPPVAGFLPHNLLIHVDGGPPSAGDALVVAGGVVRASANAPVTNIVPLGATDFVVVNRSRRPDEGTVRVFRSAAAMPDISYTDIEIVSPMVAPVNPNTGHPNLLLMGPDMFEGNETRATAAYLGSGDAINVQNLTIFPNANEHRFVPADVDYFRVVAKATGVLDFQVYFRNFADTLIPGGGSLDVEVLDSVGNVIASQSDGFHHNSAPTPATPNDSRARIRIPAVQGETYYLRVFGADGQTLAVNGYDLTIFNQAPPVPFDIELKDAPVDDTTNPPGGSNNSDTGRSQFDNITYDNTPTIFLRLDDAIFLNDIPGNATPPPGAITIPFNSDVNPAGPATNPGFRVGIFVENNTHSEVLLGFAQPATDPLFAGPGVYEFTFTTPLDDGSWFISSRVQMIDPANSAQSGWGARSQSLEIIVDTVPPNVAFGLPDMADDGLLSDTGVSPPNYHTVADRITSETRPIFWGIAEANSIIRLYADGNGNGVFDPGTAVFLGQTTATPLDGTNQEPHGYWEIRSVIDLNDPAHFPEDGLRTIFVTATDVAGNINVPGDDFGSDADEILRIFIDTQGPQITDVEINNVGNPYDLFDPKPSQGPTPLVHSLVISIRDLPDRIGEFLYPAIKEDIALHPGHYHLVGDANGVIPIQRVIVYAPDAVGPGPVTATATITLEFLNPLPDDRFTLTISDRGILDLAGNRLDGESNAAEPHEPTPPATIRGVDGVPSGDGIPGGDFVARFTIDSRPEIGVYHAGSVWVDTNGNWTFDPDNLDHTNRDIVYTFGVTTDKVFAGNFAPRASAVASAAAPGASQAGTTVTIRTLAAHHLDVGQTVTISGVGVGDYNGTFVVTSVPNSTTFTYAQPIIGLADSGGGSVMPHADGFDKLAAYGRIGNDFRWLIDWDNDGVPDLSIVEPMGRTGYPVAGNFDGNADNGDEVGLFAGGTWYFDTTHDYQLDTTVTIPGMFGIPFVGDFNGDGRVDLGTWYQDTFYISLSLDDGVPGGVGFGNWSTTLTTFDFGFIGVRERPVVADFDQDGYTDIGLWVPDRLGANQQGVGEWYILVSGGQSLLNRIVTDPSTGRDTIHFKPIPFGNDIYATFGNEFAIPVVGNFDPPVASSSGVGSGSSHTNSRDPADVNNDGVVTPQDALVMINDMNQHGARTLGEWVPGSLYLDVNADGEFTPADILVVINRLNDDVSPASGGEGEWSPSAAEIPSVAVPLGTPTAPTISVAANVDPLSTAGIDSLFAESDEGDELDDGRFASLSQQEQDDLDKWITADGKTNVAAWDDGLDAILDEILGGIAS